jgi:FMN phosphatase YigB (HAD superfamily)
VQGLLADGQCFTAAQLQRGLTLQDCRANLDLWINPALRVLSYEVRGRKPSERLFRQSLEALAELGIPADQVLHIGSRVQHDLVPARRLGMRTALFAGDKSSVQASPELLKGSGCRPDVLLTDLAQITEVIG